MKKSFINAASLKLVVMIFDFLDFQVDIREELNEGLYSAARPSLQESDAGRAQPHRDAQSAAATRRASGGAARHGTLPAVAGVPALP